MTTATTTPASTVTAANLFVAALMLPVSPSIGTVPVALEQESRSLEKTTMSWFSNESDRGYEIVDVGQSTSLVAVSHVTQYDETIRPTTSQEKLVGELRSWGMLTNNWDGEGAAAPDVSSLKEAVAFIRLLDEDVTFPEPMLHASGHAGLFWKDENLYADIEFLGARRIAYYIERHGDKHKGVLKFDLQKMPAVFSALLLA